MTTTIYKFDPETGEYAGTMLANVDSFGDELLPPPNHKSRTLEAPPSADIGRAVCRINGVWVQVEDHRGKVVYSTENGTEREISDLGPLPVNVTTEPRPNQWHNWDVGTGAWVEDTVAKQAFLIPTSVTPRQARLAIEAAGLTAQVEAAVDAAGLEARITWDYALEIRRDDPLIAQLGAGLSLSSEQIDALFVAAFAL